MKKFFPGLYAILALVVFTQCTATKKVTSTPKVLEGVSEASALLDIVNATNLPYTWYTATGTGLIDWDGQRLSAKINVRIRQDSVIWVQISKLGFEVARMLVTPDSALFINRIERLYGRYGADEFSKKYNMPADFDMFARVFTGGAVIPPSVTKMQVESDGALYIESSLGITARHWIDTDRRLIKSQINDRGKHEWTAGYGNYTAVNTGQLFPMQRSNTLVQEGQSNLFDLEYSSVMIDVPAELPFSIPSHYEKM